MDEAFEEGLVSVIIPTYNREQFITDAMDSVLSQAYRPIELLVVDDGSTDDTRAVIAEWKDKSSGADGLSLRYLVQEKQGAPAARNLGMIESRGEYIQFLDSDDVLSSRKIRNQVSLFPLAKSNIATYSDYGYFTFSKGRVVVDYKKIAPPENDLLAATLSGWWVPCNVPLWRRKDVSKLGPWQEDLEAGQDTEYTRRFLFGGGTFVYCAQSLCYIRKHKMPSIGAIARKRGAFESRVQTAVQAEEYLKNAGLLTRYGPHLARSYFGHAMAATLHPDIKTFCLMKSRELSPAGWDMPGTFLRRLRRIVFRKILGIPLGGNFLHLCERFRGILGKSTHAPDMSFSSVKDLYCGNRKSLE